MANNKSAKKRIKINKRNRLINKYYKTSVKTLTKKFFINLRSYKLSENLNEKKNLEILLNSLYSLLDKGVKKNVYHKNKVARIKSKLFNSLK